MVIPNRHDKDHSSTGSLRHGGQPTLGSKCVGITKRGLLSGAEIIRDGISSYTSDLTLRVGNNIAILDVEAFNLGDGRTDKLRDDCKLLAGVDSKARPIERRVTHAVRVKVAAGLVTSARSGVW